MNRVVPLDVLADHVYGEQHGDLHSTLLSARPGTVRSCDYCAPSSSSSQGRLAPRDGNRFARKETKVDNARAEPRLFIYHEHEDVSIKKLRGDTGRAKSDEKEAKLSKRMARNMLPCAEEIDQGDVWMRTADWRAVYLR